MIGDWEYLPHVDVDGCDVLADVAFEYRERFRAVIRDVVTGRLEEARLEHALSSAAGEWAETRLWAVRDGRGETLSVRGHSRLISRGTSVLSGDGQSVGIVRDALERGEFELYAQPIVDLLSGRTSQHELLLRLRDPDGSLLQPAAFLPVAEATGMVLGIDEWVAGQALALAARGHPVEFNLSARSVCSEATIDWLGSMLDETGAPPSLVVIELTETALLADETAAERFIGAARAMGCRVALDDFGTGFSSLAHLKRLSVDYLKIDKEFVIDLPSSGSSRRVVEAIVALARGFGQLTVAEGAEDPDILPLLAELGVDLAQGYGIAEPGPLVAVMGTTPVAAR